MITFIIYSITIWGMLFLLHETFEENTDLRRQLRMNVKAMEHEILIIQAARNLLSALTPVGEVEKLAARDLAALLGENHV